MTIEIKMHKFKDMNLRGATIIDGFSSVGIISSIVANHLIGTLKLDQITALDSDDFPAISMVYKSRPKYPARIFADKEKKVVVFLSEFNPEERLARPLANTMLSWAKKNKCMRIITPEGLLSREPEPNKEYKVYGVGSTDHAREDLKRLGIEQLKTGIITGVSAILLNEGRRRKFDVICLLVNIYSSEAPNAKAAAKMIEVIDKLLPKIKIDVEPLYEEAEKIEEWIKELRSPSQMYG